MSHLIINYKTKSRSHSGLDRIIYCGLAHPCSIFSDSEPQQADDKIVAQKINKKCIEMLKYELMRNCLLIL